MTTLSFKVTDNEARSIRQKARRERVSVSEYLRRRAAVPAPAAAKPEVGRCRVTGATIFQSAADRPPLTVTSTKEMLADFP
ncbi:MAG: hypothetical protein M3Q46_15080 [Verrucomicrobiota bacterium]|nr:hypothetical protein [Verrucomicrobiota bacterium]